MNIETLFNLLFEAIFWVGALSYIWMVWDTTKNKISYNWLIGAFLLWIVVVPYYLVKRKSLIEKSQEAPEEHSKSHQVGAWLSVIAWVFYLSWASSDSTNFMTCKEAVGIANELAIANLADFHGVLESKVSSKIVNVSEVYTSEAERTCKGELHYQIDGYGRDAEMLRFRTYIDNGEQWVQLL
ncbi:hypothetical protein [Pseudidiomarina insulisalsae]|uniref:Uncharacterized protein n=1 Tax=Pseudidiomarina insulisalsae TaxID=575789 RepID=A0A432YF36_9GAMM|nr:hypothetical protein [Pseudidiomarina insulisalsae]RUO59554.1 hypothetical protein CWI71_09050 [Pseudidiomarina insulisalsae]